LLTKISLFQKKILFEYPIESYLNKWCIDQYKIVKSFKLAEWLLGLQF